MTAPILLHRIYPERVPILRPDPLARHDAVIGARNEIAVLRCLRDGPKRTMQLEEATGLVGGGLHRVLKRLQKSCLIGREEGLRGAYYLREPR